jgi:queuosine precursor transporter
VSYYRNLQTWFLVAAYFGAAVAANLAVSVYGPTALPVSAFLLIPFDLCARDVLHERWEGRGLGWKMAALVFWGSLLSAAASPAASRVAVASVLSFAVAGCVDALAYQLLASWPRSARMNLSNVCSAAVDSVAFPLLAFGGTTWALSSGQAGTKVAGGYLWTWLFLAALRRRRRPTFSETLIEDRR